MVLPSVNTKQKTGFVIILVMLNSNQESIFGGDFVLMKVTWKT